MCEYCSDKNIGNLSILADEDIKIGDCERVSMTMYFGRYENGKSKLKSGLFIDTETVKEIDCNINYCPFCGRKL